MPRSRRLAPAALSVALLVFGCSKAGGPRFVEAGRMGRVAVFPPGDDRRGFVYLISDSSGWNRALDEEAAKIAESGAVVVGVDLPRYLAGLVATKDDGCHYTVAELEDWSHRLQREFAFPRYRSPILAGIGVGATLAHAALAQSPAATLAGAIGIDPKPVLATHVPLCEGAKSQKVPGGFVYQPAETLPGFWREAPAGAEPALERLGSAVADSIDSEANQDDTELADLPLVEIPAEGDTPAKRFAVIYSGDGGWRDLDKEIGEYFAAHGTPCVGIDSLRYFWGEKKPEDVAADLARIIRHYQEAWATPNVVLVGYSFGAGILPFAVNRLPADVRGSVQLVSLLGIESRAPFEIAVEGWLGGLPENAPEALPEIAKLDLSRLQCFYGEEEEDTLCKNPKLASAEIIHTTGGHHFDGDYEALAEHILAGSERVAAAQQAAGPKRRPAPAK